MKLAIVGQRRTAGRNWNSGGRGLRRVLTVSRGWHLILVMLAMPLFARPALADYQLNPGDVIQITVGTAPELRARVALNDEGVVSFAQVGDVRAAGLTVLQLSRRIEDALLARKLAASPDVKIAVVAYRPLLVRGDVASPGTYPYRPGFNVRDAVAIANNGGYSTQMFANNILQFGEHVRAEIAAASIELLKNGVRVARLKAELDGRMEIEATQVQTVFVSAALRSELLATEALALKAETANKQKETAHFQSMIKVTLEQISALAEARKKEASGLEQLQQDTARARELLQRGLVQAVRVEEQQRATTFSQSRLLDVDARSAQARRDLQAFNRQLEEVEDKREIKILKDLEEASVKLAAARARLRSFGVHLPDNGPAEQRRERDEPGSQRFIVVRNVQGTAATIVAQADTMLLPGDTVEVSRTQ
jgi:polysaccharide biosynthesis/export protein